MKLHEKVKKFEIDKNVIYFYGTEMRSYCQYINEQLQHERRKMQTIYKWRLDKLFKEESAYHKEVEEEDKEKNEDKCKDKDHDKCRSRFSSRAIKRFMPKNIIANQMTTTCVELVISSESYFLVLTDILELIVLEKSSMKIKFTMILNIPHDGKVMWMTLGPKEKLLALLMFNQKIFIFNLHTQDQYQLIKPTPLHKFTAITFLDLKNEYLLANGTESGKIVLSPFNLIPEKNTKILQLHKKAISSLSVVRKECLVSCSEDMLISIWMLPFNILKHEIRVGRDIGFVIGEVGVFKEFVYLRGLEGGIIELNSH